MAHQSCDRRFFLRSLLLGAGSVFTMASPLSMVASAATASGVSALGDPLLLLRQAKDHFYRRQYGQAAPIYQQLIAAYPHGIAYYDGYAKVLKAQQRLSDVAELWREGLRGNPSDPAFMHRLALSIHTIAYADRKASATLELRYSHQLLSEVAAVLLLDAIAIAAHNKGLRLSLLDIQQGVAGYNQRAAKISEPTISFPAALRAQISAATEQVLPQWSNNREAPTLSSSIEANQRLSNIAQRHRRTLFTESELLQRASMLSKDRKHCLMVCLSQALDDGDISSVERIGTQILEQDVEDTQTVGMLRRFYRKCKAYDRLVALNRYLYAKHDTFANRLSLAGSLRRYRSGDCSTEILTLLSIVKPYVETLSPIYICSYYLSYAHAQQSVGAISEARAALIEAMGLLEKVTPVLYTVMEHYAMTYMEQEPTIAIQILDAIAQGGRSSDIEQIVPSRARMRAHSGSASCSGSELSTLDPYLDSYHTACSIAPEEQLKPLYAKARIYKRTDNAQYQQTIEDIRILRASLGC